MSAKRLVERRCLPLRAIHLPVLNDIEAKNFDIEASAKIYQVGFTEHLIQLHNQYSPCRTLLPTFLNKRSSVPFPATATFSITWHVILTHGNANISYMNACMADFLLDFFQEQLSCVSCELISLQAIRIFSICIVLQVQLCRQVWLARVQTRSNICKLLTFLLYVLSN